MEIARSVLAYTNLRNDLMYLEDFYFNSSLGVHVAILKKNVG